MWASCSFRPQVSQVQFSFDKMTSGKVILRFVFSCFPTSAYRKWWVTSGHSSLFTLHQCTPINPLVVKHFASENLSNVNGTISHFTYTNTRNCWPVLTTSCWPIHSPTRPPQPSSPPPKPPKPPRPSQSPQPPPLLPLPPHWLNVMSRVTFNHTFFSPLPFPNWIYIWKEPSGIVKQLKVISCTARPATSLALDESIRAHKHKSPATTSAATNDSSPAAITDTQSPQTTHTRSINTTDTIICGKKTNALDTHQARQVNSSGNDNCITSSSTDNVTSVGQVAWGQRNNLLFHKENLIWAIQSEQGRNLTNWVTEWRIGLSWPLAAMTLPWSAVRPLCPRRMELHELRCLEFARNGRMKNKLSPYWIYQLSFPARCPRSLHLYSWWMFAEGVPTAGAFSPSSHLRSTCPKCMYTVHVLHVVHCTLYTVGREAKNGSRLSTLG